ncbi:exonuclease domain-containing protein [Marinactinospora thermotolerans]|uniref:DNA polymerase III, epsilon subunit n=1 Tax=Marinactinospora thermotolerans DSM 45154 TaxID=1122192 RepID=A0A1T4SS26_9ACTN|nr:exonuclease domain-containing protein [Marinactinospora thermotolerans]SKA31039.1 DNA polymerase III, epsilon subunit [Marinactinospora thermotolerans DSM 45154]
MRNRYPGACRTCGVKVAAGAGTATRGDGRWYVHCAEHVPAAAPAAPPPPRGDHPGWHTSLLAGYDCETSGRDPRSAFLVSAALVDTRGEQRSWLVDPGEREIPPAAVAVHGITTERARAEGVPAEQALDEIAEALSAHLAAGRGLVVFNAPFDLTVLDAELARRGMKSLTERVGHPPSPIIDPLVIDRGLDPHRGGPRTLGAMCAFYGFEVAGAHTANGDATACLELARELGARYPEIASDSLEELHERQVEWASAYARQRRGRRDRPQSDAGRGEWPVPFPIEGG